MSQSYLTVPAHECWPCCVGSGECLVPATFVEDDGKGGDAYFCNFHHKQFLFMLGWIDEPGNYEKLKAAVDRVE